MQSEPFLSPIPRHPLRTFLLVWFGMTLVFLFLLYAAGLAPRSIAEIGDTMISPFVPDEITPPANTADTYTAVGEVSATPRIVIPKLGLDAAVMLPASANIDLLNNELLKGVVHYPGSALPDEMGNVFMFGHSTGLKVVHNKNFEVFNGIRNLASGDIVRIRYGAREYWYRVSSVTTKKADDALVNLGPNQGRKLTLSTCRTFGAKEDRFVVEADFIKSYPLRSQAKLDGAQNSQVGSAS